MIDKGMRWLIKNALEKLTNLKVYDYEQLLGLSKGFSIGEFTVKAGSWLENKKLRELKLDKEGVLVLAIYRHIDNKEQYIGVPDGDTEIKRGDKLICYGLEKAIKNLSQRLRGRKGDKEHKEAMKEEEKRKEEEKKEIEKIDKA